MNLDWCKLFRCQTFCPPSIKSVKLFLDCCKFKLSLFINILEARRTAAAFSHPLSMTRLVLIFIAGDMFQTKCFSMTPSVDQNSADFYTLSRLNCLKNIPFRAAHTTTQSEPYQFFQLALIDSAKWFRNSSEWPLLLKLLAACNPRRLKAISNARLLSAQIYHLFRGGGGEVEEAYLSF